MSMGSHHQQRMNAPFATVLVARKANEPPSELEIKLRSASQRLRIVEKLSGGAHLLLPGSETIAVRSYGARRITSMEQVMNEGTDGDDEESKRYLRKLQGRQNCEEPAPDAKQETHAPPTVDDDIDGLRTFRDSFKHPVIFFVLPPGEMQRDQLGNANSFTSKAQRALLLPRQQVLQTGAGNASDREQQLPGSARVFVVPDVNSALQIMLSVMESVKPSRLELKRKFFEKEADTNFLPDIHTGLPPSEASVAAHVRDAFHSWAERSEVPPGDAGVLLSFMGTLGKVFAAGESVLDNVPVRDETKSILLRFLHGSSEHDDESNPKKCHTSIDQFSDTSAEPIPGKFQNHHAQERSQEGRISSSDFHGYGRGYQSGGDFSTSVSPALDWAPVQPPTNHVASMRPSTLQPHINQSQQQTTSQYGQPHLGRSELNSYQGYHSSSLSHPHSQLSPHQHSQLSPHHPIMPDQMMQSSQRHFYGQSRGVLESQQSQPNGYKDDLMRSHSNGTYSIDSNYGGGYGGAYY